MTRFETWSGPKLQRGWPPRGTFSAGMDHAETDRAGSPKDATRSPESSGHEQSLVLEQDVDAFVREPLGRYVMGSGWLHFCATPGLWGAMLWGRAEQQNLTSLFELVERTIERAGEHVSLLDIRGLEHVDLASFGLIGRYMSRHRSTLARHVIRHAVIRAEGVLGAVVSGSYEIFAAPYPVSLFTDVEAALAWLDPPLERSIRDNIARLCESAAGVPSLLTQLHAVLGTDLDNADLARAAARMGITARTLQRRLQALGTSFRAELDITRIREAQRRMLHSDSPLTEVAVDLGFSSLQNFSRQFRRVVGEAPSAWRQRVRTRN
jgi:AraC-like DNA-binding protein